MGKETLIKNWEYFSPDFEFTKDLSIDSSAWSGHYSFAYDLVANTKPKIIVELGTHKGNSFFSFSQAVKDLNLDTELHAIDTWEGDSQTGYYGNEIFTEFKKIVNKYYKNVNIVPHKKYFDDALNEFENNSIDILHIDGLHTYEAVKHDFENWLPKVNKKSGIILLHDVCEKSDDFGVYKLWAELKNKYKRHLTFEHSHGLGIIFFNEYIYNLIVSELPIFNTYYSVNADRELFSDRIKDKDNHIKNLEELIEAKSKEMDNLETELKTNYKECINLKSQLEVKSTEIENLKSMNRHDKTIIEMKDTHIKNITAENTALESLISNYIGSYNFQELKNIKLWRFIGILISIKKYLKNFFINLYKDGIHLTFKRIYLRIKNYFINRRNRKRDANPYKYWLRNNKITLKKKILLKKEFQNLEYKPLISIVMPVYNVDVKWIKEAIKSIKRQIYTNWEVCIADDASTNPELITYLKKLSEKDKFKITFRKTNGHISQASNSALKLAKGEFIALMDNDDIIHPHALLEIAKVLNKNKNTDLIYSDEDKIEINEVRVEPFFKPDWSPDLFMSTNYLCHLTVIKKELVDSIKGFRKGYEGSQDYDLFLRITEKTNKIVHIPDVLYSWRKIPGSTAAVYDNKGYADKASFRALTSAIKRRGLNANVSKGLFPGTFRVRYKILGNPLISIIIPTKDKLEYLERCVSSLIEKTTYKNYEVLIIDTGSIEKRTLDYYKDLKKEKQIRIIKWKKPFNYSSVNNFGVNNAKGEYVLLLNNDTEIISSDWIEGMLEHAQREEIGAVGVKLLYPNNTIQHVGVVLGIAGPSKQDSIAGHIMKSFPKDIMGIPFTKDIIRNYSAVTAACLMIKKEKFLEMNGMDEKYRIAFNDIDFGIRLYKSGYYNLYTPFVELYHHESISVGTPNDGKRDMVEFAKEVRMMINNWGEIIYEDPFYNKNLNWGNTNSEINTYSKQKH